MSAIVDEGTLLLALIDPGVSALSCRVLEVLAGDGPPLTLDALAARVGDVASRPWVFAAVARLEDRGWLAQGVIR